MSQASMVIGVVAVVGLCIGMFPCLGWLNWFNGALAFTGMILGIFGLAADTSANRNTTPGTTGILINVSVMIVGFIRLLLGGGIF